MYETIRKTHLYTGLSLLTFVVMYFVTGWFMIHGSWFPASELRRSTRLEVLSGVPEMSPEACAAYLQDRFDLRGKPAPPQQMKDGRWRYRYAHPGVAYEVTLSAGRDSAQIVRTEEPFLRLMNSYHRLRGYGEGGFYSLWSLLYDLASAALILFAISGIYMWYKLTRRRWPGWLLLGLSFGYTVATMIYLVHAP